MSPLDDVQQLLVLAAFPGDAAGTAGDLIAESEARGMPVQVVVACDGSSEQPGSPLRLARECFESMARLAPSGSLSLLGFADAEVKDEWDAVAIAIDTIVAESDPRSLVLAPAVDDGHPVRRALGELAAQAAVAHRRVLRELTPALELAVR